MNTYIFGRDTTYKNTKSKSFFRKNAYFSLIFILEQIATVIAERRNS